MPQRKKSDNPRVQLARFRHAVRIYISRRGKRPEYLRPNVIDKVKSKVNMGLEKFSGKL
jgi:hypothetical protein